MSYDIIKGKNREGARGNKREIKVDDCMVHQYVYLKSLWHFMEEAVPSTLPSLSVLDSESLLPE